MNLGKKRIKLGILLTRELERLEVGTQEVDPREISPVRGGERKRDQARWGVWVPLKERPNVKVYIYSWATITECVKHGVKLVPDPYSHLRYEAL